jgi:hypothetical protein
MIAGAPAPSWVERGALPQRVDDTSSEDASITEWDSVLFGVGVHLRTVTTQRYLYSEYLPGAVHDGTEGELYDMDVDPLQRENRFDDPTYAVMRAEL